MSKKSKRQVRNGEALNPSNETSTPSARSAGFNPDYSYVVKDLRRIGALAGGFILILVVLTFFLR